MRRIVSYNRSLIGVSFLLLLPLIANAQKIERTAVWRQPEGKISGYIQARYEFHQDSRNEADTAGQSFNKDYFYIRRGRIKLTYAATKTSQFTLQLDASKDGVSLKDAEVKINFPIRHRYRISIKMGQFKWPFSYEILRSSADREMPERILAIRTLLPGERDRGVQLGLTPNDIVELNVGLFNGYGISDKTYPIITPTRNPAVVGRLAADFKFLSLGVSGFMGTNAFPGAPDSINDVTRYVLHDKNRFGADLQFPYRLPILGSGQLMAEAIQGKDWNTTKNSYAQSVGGYLQLVQTVFGKSQIAVRYDDWDPDTDVDKDGITTLGFALLHYFGGNVKLTVAYELPKNQNPANETNDNFLTIQLQYKF